MSYHCGYEIADTPSAPRSTFDSSFGIFRRVLKDRSFIEGLGGERGHTHYARVVEPTSGLPMDVPVAVTLEDGEKLFLRTKETLNSLKARGLIK